MKILLAMLLGSMVEVIAELMLAGLSILLESRMRVQMELCTGTMAVAGFAGL